MKTEHKIRASVRLTEQAHLLLSEMAKTNKESMKQIGNKAISLLDGSSKRERALLTYIDELEFGAKKREQVHIVQFILACLGMGLLGFIVGVSV